MKICELILSGIKPLVKISWILIDIEKIVKVAPLRFWGLFLYFGVHGTRDRSKLNTGCRNIFTLVAKWSYGSQDISCLSLNPNQD